MKDRRKLQVIIISIIIAISSIFIYKGAIAPKLYEKYLNTGIKYLTDGNYEEAILAFDKAIKIEGKSTEARVYKSKAYIGNKEFDKAVEVLEEAQNIDITNEELLKEILEILNEIDSDIAYEFLDKFINIIGKDNISAEIKELLDSAYEAPTEPIVDPKPDKYISDILVRLKLDKMKVGHSYYYTLDGSEPTKKSQKYVGNISINKSTEINIIGFNKNDEATDKISLKYEIDKNVKSEIEQLIKNGQSLMDSVEVGTEVGNCVEGSKEEFSKVIKKAKKELNELIVTYDKAMEIKDEIQNAIDDFEYNIIEDTDKEELNNAINKAQKKYNNAVEGSNQGQYEVGSKATLLNVIKDSEKLNNSILAKQDEINDMVDKINKAIKDFENKKVKPMPSDLGEKYLSRIKYEESKAKAIYNDLNSSMADIRGAASDESQAYQQILSEIYIDLNKYLTSSKKQEAASNKIQFENEKNKVLRDYEASAQAMFDEFGPGALGTSYDGGESEVGELAKKYCLNLINKYMI